MSSEDLSLSTINSLLEDVQLHVSPDLMKRHLQKVPRMKLQAWVDSYGLDLMHHAILEGNLVCVSLLLTLGHFKPPHQLVPPATDWTYVHLAAVLGHRAIVSMLLQERPFDNKRVVLDWDLFHASIAPKLDITKAAASIVPAEGKEKSSPFLPLDLAARYGHVQCVKTILDFHIFHPQQSHSITSTSSRTRAQTSGHMHMAVTLDSPYAVRILLSDQPQTEEVKSALDIALKMAKPECVDALLRFGVDTKLLFGGMNLFHVLFTYSKSFEESWFESLVSVTSVLLRHGHDVNACRPSRTFPLYSLLRCTRLTSVEKSTPFVMAALLLLLQAGADPNFDEVFVEEAVRDVEQNTAFGRRPYPSGLHCVIDTAYNYMEEVSDPEHVRKYAYKLCELLLHHGADASYIGRYRCAVVQDSDRGWLRGNALHALCDAMPSLGPVDSSLLLLLLRHGADADACVDGRYPLTAYFDALCSRSFTAPDPPAPPQLGPDPPRRHSTPRGVETATAAAGPAAGVGGGARSLLLSRSLSISIPASPPPGRRSLDHGAADAHVQDLCVDVRRVCRMVGFMSLHSQQACASMLRARLASLSDDDDINDDGGGGGGTGVVLGLKVALREVEKYAACVPSLRRCCAITVWRLCRRHAGNVYRLPLPTPLINTVMDYV